MPRDVGIANRLRAAGLKVVEVAGWKERGSSTFTPDGSVDHHTAGSRNGNAPSLAVCTYGRSDLPGPLCHVLIGRDNTCYVIAAGRANHAGTGGWSGISGNTNVYGIERENVGTPAEPWTPKQTETAARAHAALIGRRSPLLVCEHKEWAPNRKVDAHSVSGGTMRALVQRFQDNPSPQEIEDMTPDEFAHMLNTHQPTRQALDKILLGQNTRPEVEDMHRAIVREEAGNTRPFLAWTGTGPIYVIGGSERQTKRQVRGWDNVDVEVWLGTASDGVFKHTDGRQHPQPFELGQAYLDSLPTVDDAVEPAES